jgi:hypothetical protein
VNVNSCAMVFTMSAATEDLEPEQERSSDADLVGVGILLGGRPAQMEKGGPGDAGYDDENAEHLDPASDDADGEIERWFERRKPMAVIHGRTSGGSGVPFNVASDSDRPVGAALNSWLITSL